MKILKTMLMVISISFLCVIFNQSLLTVSAAGGNGIVPLSYRDSLPVQYEIWYSHKQGPEYRNYVYRDYTYANGYNRTDTLVGNIELSPLDYDFYSKAELWKVSYSFY